MNDVATAPTLPRTLPDDALAGPGRREPLWVHASLSAPLTRWMRGRRPAMVTRGGGERNDQEPAKDE